MRMLVGNRPLAAHETKFFSPKVYFAYNCYVGKADSGSFTMMIDLLALLS